MKKVLVTCLVLFAAVSSSFAYNNVVVNLTESGAQTATAAIFATTTINYSCYWSGISSGWSYIQDSSNGLIDSYVYSGAPGTIPSYSASHAGTFNTVELYLNFSCAPGSGNLTYGIAYLGW